MSFYPTLITITFSINKEFSHLQFAQFFFYLRNLDILEGCQMKIII